LKKSTALVALPDRPHHILYWDAGLKPELLQGLGEFAVTTAQMEGIAPQNLLEVCRF
jgi:hypothetical protein